MSNQSFYTTTDLKDDPKLKDWVFARAFAGNPTIVEDIKTHKRIFIVQIPEPSYKDPWGKPPKEVLEQWEKAEQEFEELDRKQPQPSFTSGEEMVKYIMNSKA